MSREDAPLPEEDAPTSDPDVVEEEARLEGADTVSTAADSVDADSADAVPADASSADAGLADAASGDAIGAKDGPDGSGPGSLEEPLDPMTVLTIERDEYLDTLRRVQADFENYKKRVARQQTEQLDRAAEGLVNKLLPALDTLELAVTHNDADTEIGRVLGQVSAALYDALGKEGLEKVDPLDQEFDPNEAEAVMHEPADEGQSGHVVVEVLRPGYRWRGRVLRAAMVKVRG